MIFKDVPEKYIKFFIYLFVVVLINLAGVTLFFRLDITENRIYSISGFSKKVVSTLSEPLTINVFFTKNLPPPYNNVERYLHDLLEEYSIYSNKFFNYHFYDVSPEEGGMTREARGNRDLARNYGIHPVQIQNIENDQVKFQIAFMGLALIHGDIIERIPTITSTEGLEYKLTMAIQKLNNKISALLNLSDKIEIKLFLSSSLKDVAPFMGVKELSELPEKFENIIAKLNEKNYGKIKFNYIDPSTEKELEEITKQYNVLNLKWPTLSNGQVPAGKGVIGLAMEYKDKSLDVPLLNVLRIPIIGTRYDLADMDSMEETLNENIELLVDINEDIGYLTDHKTLSLSGPMSFLGRDQNALSIFRELVSRNYTIKDVSLKTGKIPDSINSLIIAGPTEKFTDYELFQIDQALMRGKNLALFLDAFKEEPSHNQQPLAFSGGPSYLPLNTGLEKLLKHYGISIKKSYVLDENSYKQRISRRFGGGERPLYFVPIIKNKNINYDVALMKNIKGLVVNKISPLVLDDKRVSENGLTAQKLFSSSESSWEMSGQINLNPLFMRPPASNEEKRSMALAYVLEGEFPSYFAGKPIPEKEEEKATDSEKTDEKKTSDDKSDDKTDLSKIEEKGGLIAKGRPAKIFLVASSELLKDNMLDEEGKSTNATFIMNVLDALNNREGVAEMRSKEQSFNPLFDIAGGAKTFVKSFNIIGLPVLVVLFGLGVYMKRNTRKKRIQMIFENPGVVRGHNHKELPLR